MELDKNTSIMKYSLSSVRPMFSELRLPRLISDGMVLQRDIMLNIWGWAIPGETVTLVFLEKSYQTIVGDDGEWHIYIPPMEAGGPYTMEIKTSKKIILRDILIGDVWVCSGQSNMVLPMARVSDLYEEEISLSYNLLIRVFTVPERYDFNVEYEDMQSGKWENANPENILHFTAAGYFFATALNEKYHIPIGLINASVGGSPVEAWLSMDSLKKFPEHKNKADQLKDNNYIIQMTEKDEMIQNNWYDSILQNDEGLNTDEEKWFDENYNALEWKLMNFPAFWEDEGLGRINGVVWFRKEIQLGAEMAGKPAKLLLGRIVNSDSVYVNGHLVGTTSYQYPPRKYAIPGNVLKEGKNIIVIRVVNTSGKGGFIKDKPYFIKIAGRTFDLKGVWQYKIGTVAEPLSESTFLTQMPLGLFNGMISPLIKFSIKGVVWYQGESNVTRAKEYYLLFSELIHDWRKKWNQGNYPFLYVQLPNYMEVEDSPGKGKWAELREAQLKALNVPNTGMIVAIDLGEWNDLHPLNKRDIGRRLSFWAQKLAYGDDKIVCSGPIYKDIKAKGQKLIIEFSSIGNGLVAKNNSLECFSIAGSDLVFIKAKACIEGNKVIVWNEEIWDPVAVQYAWSDNPENADLYNKEGLPASPFRAFLYSKR